MMHVPGKANNLIAGSDGAMVTVRDDTGKDCCWSLIAPFHTGWAARQSKMLLTIEECGSKMARNSVFDCHLSPVWRQMAIKNSVSNYFLFPLSWS